MELWCFTFTDSIQDYLVKSMFILKGHITVIQGVCLSLGLFVIVKIYLLHLTDLILSLL